MRQHVGGTQGDNAKPGRRPHQAIGNLGNRAVPAGGNHQRLPGLGGGAGDRFGMATAGCLRQIDADAVGNHDIQHPPKQLRAPPPGDRIKNNDHRPAIEPARSCGVPWVLTMEHPNPRPNPKDRAAQRHGKHPS